MRKCRDCPADITGRSHRADRCASCQRKRQQDRATKRRHARIRRRVRKCQDCGADIRHRYGNATLCIECRGRHRTAAMKRHDDNRYTRPERIRQRWKMQARRPPGPVFLRCPDGQTFDRWLDDTMASPPPRLPELHHEPENWRPFNVPDYLK